MIQNRIKETILYPWGDLVELQPSNLKVPYNIEYLKKSIIKNGFVMSFYGWEHDGKVMVVDGHSRKDVLLDLIADGIDVPEMLPVTLVDAKDEQDAVRLLIEVFNQKSNPIDQTARDMWFEDNAWDVSEVEWEGVNMVVWGEDKSEEVLDAKEDDFDTTPPEIPITVLGDLYEIGEHRLLCGDSTQTDTFEKLMQGQFADMVVTDPPYNVAYEGKTKDALTIENDSMGNDEFYKFLYDFYTALTTAVKKGGAIYVWHASSEVINFGKAMVDAGWLLKQQLIWVKNTMVMGRQDYQWKHEPCLYGWLAGDSHKWYSDRKQTTVIEWDKPQRNGEHPTMKPIGLFAYQIQNSSKVGDLVIDAFGGSGTTMVACEQLKRKARVIEYDPKYCDVIVKRMIKLDDKLTVKRNGIDVTKDFKQV